MENRSVFTFESYKDILQEFLLGANQRGQLSRAAEFLNCQRSYISKVIKTNSHITPDQAYLFSKFWKLTTDEREYFSTLVEFERAGQHDYKTYLKNKLTQLKKKYESIQERTQRQDHVTDNLQLHYFSNWISCAIQFLTMIPQYQDEISISERLGLKKDIVLQHLSHLQNLEVVEYKNKKWLNKSSNFHLPKESPLVILHHQNWRTRAILDAQNFSSDHVHFTGVYTLSKTDYERVKDLLLNFIAEANSIVGPSECEEAIALTCDFFRI